MVSIHQKIVDEIFQEYKDKKEVISIWVFGSVAVGKERPDSDVDITIVYDNNREWELFKEERYGITIDFEVINMNVINMLLDEYPYLADFEKAKIILDKTGFLQQSVERLKKYHTKNPEVATFWENEYDKMRKAKTEGVKSRNYIDVCDEAEIKFSNHHSIKRKILTRAFFHKHMKKHK